MRDPVLGRASTIRARGGVSATAIRARIRVLVSLAAGAVAISVNTLMLAAADRFHLITARGGLLTLIVKYCSGPMQRLGLPILWSRFGLPRVASYPFQLAFHIMVGICMALFYAIYFAPKMRRAALTKGALSALCVWLLNAGIILPLIGEGFAGSAVLGIWGIVYFAIAHTAFFVILAYLYERWIDRGELPQWRLKGALNARSDL
jgi:hypothetical protein